MKTILYARVSTADQTIAHQRKQAEAAGFQIDTVVADEDVSGVHTRLADRPEGRRLFDLLRTDDTLVVRWVDRLGRNYADVCDTIREFMRRGVVIRTVINGLTFNGATTDPMQQAVRDALIAFMAATAQAQAEARPRKPRRPGSSTPRPKASTWAASRHTPARNIRPCSTCSLRARASPLSPRPRACLARRSIASSVILPRPRRHWPRGAYEDFTVKPHATASGFCDRCVML